MNRVRINELLQRPEAGGEVTIHGWVRTCRHSKGFSFLEINDGSIIHNIQCVVDADVPNYDRDVKALQTGASVRVTGRLVDSPGKGQRFEIQAKDVHVYGNAEGYPLQKKGHTMEFLRSIAHLRARSNTFGAVLRVRNVMARAIHDFFQSRGFVYLHTPIITASDCEGAGEMFRVTTLDAGDPPRAEGEIDFAQDFFGKPTSLTVSGQLSAETAALALSDVYTFGPTFRAENSNTTRHLAEFWMVEPECAFFDLDDDVALAEAFLKHIFSTVLSECPDDMDFFNKRIDKTAIETLRHIVESPFERMSYSDAIEILSKSGKSFEFPIEWGLDLQSEHERYLTEEHVKRPLVLTDYPRDIKAFYMRQNDDGKTVAAMDVLVPKIGEIIGGSQREERLDRLQERMKEMGLPEEDYWWYLDTRKFGTAPHAGFGLGFERTIQFCTGMANIRDVIPFPRTPGSAEF
ncbi:Asparagine--tRNA ligase [Planctomycetes bacterium Pan216]|uniref:Asparagine--tRNA ligase n=1 Tax=Kolteria novifilia TaxID=2527975 RepID=A0A518BB51_9BACT|nr:Asparagine--tRNA ligase [Planctomycetes bacterium Pan216]